MALFQDLIDAASGVAGIAQGTQMLGAGGTTSTRQLPPPSPSDAEQRNLQIAQAIQLANLQAAGYDMTPDPGGSLTLTPRTTPSDVLQQQLGGAGAGLQQMIGNLNPQVSPFGAQLNTQALAGARGQPQVNRQALIQAIQQKQGPQPSRGLGLTAPGPSSISVGPLTSEASFANIPSIRSLSRQQAGPSSGFLSNLPAITGGIGALTALAPLLTKLFGGAGGFLGGGSSAGGGVPLGDAYSSTSAYNPADEYWGGGFDPAMWEWVSPDYASYADTFDIF